MSRVRNGVGTNLAIQRTPGLLPAGANEVRIVVRGARITVRVNGVRVFSIVDAEPILHGGVALAGIWESTPWFDNVVVRTLPVR